jgi:hypothetical protein
MRRHDRTSTRALGGSGESGATGGRGVPGLTTSRGWAGVEPGELPKMTFHHLAACCARCIFWDGRTHDQCSMVDRRARLANSGRDEIAACAARRFQLGAPTEWAAPVVLTAHSLLLPAPPGAHGLPGCAARGSGGALIRGKVPRIVSGGCLYVRLHKAQGSTVYTYPSCTPSNPPRPLHTADTPSSSLHGLPIPAPVPAPFQLHIIALNI